MLIQTQHKEGFHQEYPQIDRVEHKHHYHYQKNIPKKIHNIYSPKTLTNITLQSPILIRYQHQAAHQYSNTLNDTNQYQQLQASLKHTTGLKQYISQNKLELLYQRNNRPAYTTDNVTGCYIKLMQLGNTHQLEQCRIGKKGKVYFSSEFESGNLFSVYESKKSRQYILLVQCDTNTNGYNQWFYYLVGNLPSKTPIKFTIINMVHFFNKIKKHSLFKQGMKVCMLSLKRWQHQAVGWTREGTHIQYYQNKIYRQTSPKNSYHSLSFTIQPQYSQDVIYLSLNFPYTYSKLIKFIRAQPQQNSIIRNFRITSISQTLLGNICPMLSFYSKNKTKRKKNWIGIIARQHPGQTCSSFVMQGVIKWLNSDESFRLKDKFNFLLIPMINIDGTIYGNFRTDISGYDLNRQWFQPSKYIFPSVHGAKKHILDLIQENSFQFFIDLHGHSKKLNSFAYCCRNNAYEATAPKLIPYILSRLNKTFNFHDSTWGVSKTKMNTARAITSFQMNNYRSLTIQSSFYGYSHNKTVRHYTVTDLEQVGKDIMRGLDIYYSRDQRVAKYQLQLLECIRQNRRKRRQRKELDSGSQSQPQQGELQYQQHCELLGRRGRVQEMQVRQQKIELMYQQYRLEQKVKSMQQQGIQTSVYLQNKSVQNKRLKEQQSLKHRPVYRLSAHSIKQPFKRFNYLNNTPNSNYRSPQLQPPLKTINQIQINNEREVEFTKQVRSMPSVNQILRKNRVDVKNNRLAFDLMKQINKYITYNQTNTIQNQVGNQFKREENKRNQPKSIPPLSQVRTSPQKKRKRSQRSGALIECYKNNKQKYQSRLWKSSKVVSKLQQIFGCKQVLLSRKY